MLIKISEPTNDPDNPWPDTTQTVEVVQSLNYNGRLHLKLETNEKVTLDLGGQIFTIDLSAEQRFKRRFVDDTPGTRSS